MIKQRNFSAIAFKCLWDRSYSSFLIISCEAEKVIASELSAKVTLALCKLV